MGAELLVCLQAPVSLRAPQFHVLQSLPESIPSTKYVSHIKMYAIPSAVLVHEMVTASMFCTPGCASGATTSSLLLLPEYTSTSSLTGPLSCGASTEEKSRSSCDMVVIFHCVLAILLWLKRGLQPNVHDKVVA